MSRQQRLFHPCSEMPVERVFSHMQEMFGDRAQSFPEVLLEARLTIKLNIRPNQTAEDLCMAVGHFIQDAEALTPEAPDARPMQAPSFGRWSSPRLSTATHGPLGPRVNKT
jgi:hypothetical protein